MKKNILLSGTVGLLLAGSLASCSSDYLETQPTMNQSAATVTATTEGARRGLYGICRGMYMQYQGEQQFVNGEPNIMMFYGEVPSQDYYSTTFFSVNWGPLITMDWININNYITTGYMWNYAYTIIAQANDILAGIDGAEGTEEERAFIKAQCLTLRAHAYQRLLTVYAPRWVDSNNGEAKTVVLRTTTANGNAPRESMNNVLKQCYEDLDLAIDLYKKAGAQHRSFNWEPDLTVAYGIYARVALLKNDWEKAQTMAHNARQGYRIMTNDELFAGFTDRNADWMWSAHGTGQDDIYYYSYQTMYACNGYYAWGNSTPSGAGAINIDLYRQIPDNDVRRDWFLTEDKVAGLGIKYWYNAQPQKGDKYFQFVDNKYIGMTPASFGTSEGKKIALVQWIGSRNPDKTNFIDAYAAPQGESAGQILWSYGGQLKFWGHGSKPGNGDVLFMRSTEFLLTEAEAAAERGETATAQALMNELNGMRQPGYNCTATGQALIDEVRLYRRIELWGEGHNWFDFKRWNLPIERRAWVERDETSGNFPASVAGTILQSAQHGWVYSIPQREINYNEDAK